MLKGIPNSERDIRWHRKHLARRKKRDRIRTAHLLSRQLNGSPVYLKILDRKRKESKDRFSRRYGGVAGFFRKMWDNYIGEFVEYVAHKLGLKEDYSYGA